jgi:Signal transduction histidine kinase
MEIWIILSKIAVLGYCILCYIIDESGNITLAVLFTLAFICINFLFYLVKRRELKILVIILSMLLLGYFSNYIHQIFILLLPVNFIDIVFIFSENLWLPAICTELPLFFIQKNMMIEYIVISSLICIVYIQNYLYNKRVDSITKEKDMMRDKIHELSTKITKDIDYERQIKYTTELEVRNKLSQQIHDKLGHSISGSLIQLEAAKLYISRDSQKSEEMIQAVINILREGMESIRSTLKNIKPASEQMGINRLKLLLDEFSINSKIKTILNIKGSTEKISYVQWKIIIENIKEALTNIMKYSEANKAEINIQILSKFIKTEIKDNGIGANKIKKGMGIRGMEERTGAMGGNVIVDGTKGFSVIILLPIEGDLNGN